jgi:hypothetical protein
MRFDDRVSLAFLLSRLQTNRAFICELETFPWYHRELDPDVVVQIEEERLRKKLLLSFNDRDLYVFRSLVRSFVITQDTLAWPVLVCD